MHLGEVEVALQVETKGRPHIDELMATLAAEGYVVERL